MLTLSFFIVLLTLYIQLFGYPAAGVHGKFVYLQIPVLLQAYCQIPFGFLAKFTPAEIHYLQIQPLLPLLVKLNEALSIVSLGGPFHNNANLQA